MDITKEQITEPLTIGIITIFLVGIVTLIAYSLSVALNYFNVIQPVGSTVISLGYSLTWLGIIEWVIIAFFVGLILQKFFKIERR